MAFKRLAAHSGCSKLCSPYVLYTGGEYNDENVSTGYSHSIGPEPVMEVGTLAGIVDQLTIQPLHMTRIFRAATTVSTLSLTEKEVSVVDEELTVGDVMFALKVIPSNQVSLTSTRR